MASEYIVSEKGAYNKDLAVDLKQVSQIVAFLQEHNITSTDSLWEMIEKVSEIMDEKNPNLQNKDQVAEAVGVGAIVFYYLSSNRIIHYPFNKIKCFKIKN